MSLRWIGLVAAGVALAVPLSACGGEGTQAGAAGETVATTPGVLTSLAVSPLGLTPPFSPDVHDYFVGCGAGDNELSIAVTAADGSTAAVTAPIASPSAASQTVSVSVAEDQAIVVTPSGGGAPYWIRCLPHDFPGMSLERHPENGTPTPGYYLLGHAIVAQGEGAFAMILDPNGTPVWYRRVSTSVMNIDLQPDGRLSFMQGSGPFGLDPTAQYQLLQLQPWSVTQVAAVGSTTDFHELRTLPNGDHYVLSYPFVPGFDLSDLGTTFGDDETIADCVIQELDPTGAVVWQWRGTDHIDPVLETTDPYLVNDGGQTIIDPIHCNSIEPWDDGHVMISARDLDAVWLIDKASGNIVWKLGGKPYSKDGAQLLQVVGDPETGFYHQHDARLLPNGHISIFDDHSNHTGPARGIELALDLDAGTASVVWQYAAAGNSAAMGSFRRYADGSNIIAWGLSGMLAMTEVDDQGNDLLDLWMNQGNSSYRAVKVPLGTFDVGVLRAAVGHP